MPFLSCHNECLPMNLSRPGPSHQWAYKQRILRRSNAADRAGGLGGGGVLIVVHGRSRMTIDYRIPKMPARSTSGFHRPGRSCLHQARNALTCSAKSHEKWAASYYEPLSRRTCTDDRVECLFFSPVRPLPETAMGILRNYLVGA